MHLEVELDDARWRANPADVSSLAIRQRFDDNQPNAFGLSDATAEPVDHPGFSGDITRGASCNCRRLELVPHANGTHTETVGHLSDVALAPYECVPAHPSAALLVSIELDTLGECDETYGGRTRADDTVLTAASLGSAASSHPALPDASPTALIVHTPELDDGRTTRRWAGSNPPYFTREAIEWVVDRGFSHLLCDLPSIDREEDGGHLPNHRRWWELDSDDEAPIDTALPAHRRTTTEMIAVPDHLEDGPYLLDLQVPALQTDAVPSRPLVYPMSPVQR